MEQAERGLNIFDCSGTAALCARNKNLPMTFQGKYCILGSRAYTFTAVDAEGWRNIS